MVNEEMDISPIMALPEEVRSVIFNLIPQTETVNLRLVCPTWNQEIQNNYEYNIKKLDEKSQNFKSILNLRIKTLEIQQLEITPVLNFDGTCIFKHPNAIRKLVIGEDAVLAQLNLHLLIGLVSKNLRVLVVNFNAKTYSYQFPSDLRFNFKHLKHLSINEVYNNDDYYYDEYEDNPTSLFHVLENSSFSNIKILTVNFDPSEKSYMSLELKTGIIRNVLRLISKQGNHLEEIFIDFYIESELVQLPVPLREDELRRIKQITTIKKLSLNLCPDNLGMTQFWVEFICNQNQLEKLYMESFPPNCPISVSLIQQITLNNSATLDFLDIQEIPLSPTDPPFDLSIFQNCQGLKTLKLRLDYQANMPRANPDAVNFHCLPPNLITLELTGFTILSEELLTAFRSNDTTGAKGFKKLQELSLMSCGNQGRFGVNSVVLYEILMTPRPSLTNADFRAGVHKGGEGMKTVLDQLQLADNIYNCFRLKRDFGEVGWKKDIPVYH